MAAPLIKTRWPGVFRRGSRYAYTWRNADGRQRWGSAATAAAAKSAKAAKEREAADERDRRALGLPAPAPEVHLGPYLLEWLDSHPLRPPTRKNYRSQALTWIIGPRGYFPAETPLSSITTQHIYRFVRWMAAEPSATTGRLLTPDSMQQVMRPLRGALRQARLEGFIEGDPARAVPIPKPPEGPVEDEDRVRVFSALELRLLLLKAPPEHRLLFDFLASTGLRISEALGLDGRHLKLHDGRPVVLVRQTWREGAIGNVKTPKSRRSVPLSTRLADPLAALRRGPKQPVFTPDGTKRYSYDWLRRHALLPTLKAAGIEHAGFHAFRHTCASFLFSRGRNVVHVQRWLGHEKASFTLNRYIHLLPDDELEPLELFPETDADAAPAQIPAAPALATA